jgi:hypothetical protein
MHRRVGVGHVPTRPGSPRPCACVTFKDVNVEELAKSELELPKGNF